MTWLAAWCRERKRERAALAGRPSHGDTQMKTSTIMNKNLSDGKASVAQPAALADFEAQLRQGRDFDVALPASLADAILATWNSGNRRIDEVRVQALKRDQLAGRWLDGETIGFGVFPDSIQLGDGQHRLRAQGASNTTQVYHVRVFGDETDFAAFVATRDSGKTRSLADLLGILHVAEGSGAAMAFERVCNAMQTFLGASPGRLSRQERLDFAYKHVKEIRYALGLPGRQFRAHTLAAIAIAYGKHPRGVGEFVAQVISGADLAAGSPALELSKALPDLNDVRGAAARDRAMGVVLRVVHDGIRGCKRTAVHPRVRSSASPIIAAVTEFAGDTVSAAWTVRHAPKAVA